MWPFFQGWFNKELNIKESYYELKCFELLLNFYFDLYIKFLRVLLACKGFTPETGMWVLDSQRCGYLTDILTSEDLKNVYQWFTKSKKCRKKAQVASDSEAVSVLVYLWPGPGHDGPGPGSLPPPPASQPLSRVQASPPPPGQNSWVNLGLIPTQQNNAMWIQHNLFQSGAQLSTPIWVWAQHFVWPMVK